MFTKSASSANGCANPAPSVAFHAFSSLATISGIIFSSFTFMQYSLSIFVGRGILFETRELFEWFRHLHHVGRDMHSDEQLMLEFKGGSKEAFEELFSRYKNSIYGYFRRRLNHFARGEELAQQTSVIIIRGAERYETTA